MVNRMDERIVEFVKKYEISDLEINDMLAISPMLEVQTFEDFMENAALLVSFGYPESDLDVLLLANPNLFVMSASDLNEELLALKKKGFDIEVILKENPIII